MLGRLFSVELGCNRLRWLRRGYIRIENRRIGIGYLRSLLAGLLCDGSVNRVHKLCSGPLSAVVELGIMLCVSRGLVLCGDGSHSGDGAVLGGKILGLICEHVLKLFGGHLPIERELKLLLSMPHRVVLLNEWPLSNVAMSSW